MSTRWRMSGFLVAVLIVAHPVAAADMTLDALLRDFQPQRGVVAVVGIPGGKAEFLTELAKSRELTVYFQSGSPEEVEAVRDAAEAEGLLGRSVFVEAGSPASIHLTPNLCDAVVVSDAAKDQTSDDEILRVLRPEARGFRGDRELVKPIPEGSDDWSHPYHGPDNNPQSNDRYVRGSFETQFIASPKFSPMPEQSVVAGGRIFKAMGHIAHKANQNPLLNTLLCINAYNGTIQWTRALPEGFMIHRNTMVATPDSLYMGDHAACHVFDALTGEEIRAITVPPEITDGPVWKWMALEGDVLYALVGNPEVQVETIRSDKPGMGHWPWGMWKGHDYSDPRTAFGYGRTLVALDRRSGQVIWHYRDEEFLDARAVCMKNRRIYCLCPEKFLACVDAESGALLWKNTDADLLAAIGPNEKAQHYITGYATTCYIKCSDDHVFFSGPQRKKMVVASAHDGSLQWTNDVGNLQLVLREDAIYAAGPQKTSGFRLDYETGTVITSFPARRACTRATGCADSIFFRATGGTVRLMTDDNATEHIAPMRPPCQDGVIISNGHLYWGPWMCGCQLSLYGNIGLRPRDDVGSSSAGESGSAGSGSEAASGASLHQIEQDSLTVHTGGTAVRAIGMQPGDWTAFRGNSGNSHVSAAFIAESVRPAWTVDVVSRELLTAPVTAGGHVFVADRTGIVRAFTAAGTEAWRARTGGAVFFPPVVHQDRLFVGCADGRVYAFEALTGRPLWTFRVAPQDRRIPVYGQLISRWPVSGGVVAEGGRIYAAAGITHYDGTYVVALDAATGRLLARNDNSGRLSDVVNSGVSLQGHLSIEDGELRFLGGGIYETARYSLETLECRNEVRHQIFSDYRTAFSAYYPEYGRYVSLEHTLPDGKVLCHDANYDGTAFSSLSLEAALPAGVSRKQKDAAGEFLQRRGKEAEPTPALLWQDAKNRRFTGFIVAGDVLVASGHPENQPDKPFVGAVRISDGVDLWEHPLPANTVLSGIATDASGRVFASLENGQLMCFSGETR